MSVLNLENASAADLHFRIEEAVTFAVRFGGIDGEHHKTWVIDQMVRALAGNKYEELVRQACDGEDGPETYSWDTGIAP